MRRMFLAALTGLLVTATADARPRLIHRRTCVSPAPVQYQTIPAPRVPVPSLPPMAVVMPQVASLGVAIPAATPCPGGVCPIR